MRLDHLPPSSTRFRMTGDILLFTPHAFMPSMARQTTPAIIRYQGSFINLLNLLKVLSNLACEAVRRGRRGIDPHILSLGTVMGSSDLRHGPQKKRGGQTPNILESESASGQARTGMKKKKYLPHLISNQVAIPTTTSWLCSFQYGIMRFYHYYRYLFLTKTCHDY
jgi:hypothetical protein